MEELLNNTPLGEFRETLNSNFSEAADGIAVAQAGLTGKVDKDGTKVLSDTNFTQAEKTKLSGVNTGATANQTDGYLLDRSNHTGLQAISTITNLQSTLDSKATPSSVATAISGKVDKDGDKVLSTNDYTSAEKTKLNGIASNATANDTDANLKNRANHTGSQAITTITNLQSTLDAKATPADINAAVANKVDKDGTKVLSDTNFTQAEKTKLSGLESSRFKGQFTTLSALNAANVGGVGNYAYVDTGASSNVQTYTWDSSDNQWVLQVGSSTAETPSSIKTKYESNADTNAYTDTEKNKLAGITSGATANATDSALRDRSTHTGVQAISTITGLQVALDSKATPDNVTAAVVNKVDKDGTKVLSDVNFTTAKDTKLNGIATGATANDTNASLRARSSHTGTQAISTVTGLQTAIDSKAGLVSPVFTGIPVAPTAANGTNTTQIATTAFTVANFLNKNENIPNELLPEFSVTDFMVFFDETQFGVVNNKITLLGSTVQLAKTTITFGTSTETSNIVNWTSVTNATQYVVRRGSTVIYTGSLLTFTDTGLTAGTNYSYTVTASADGYASSTSDVANKSTSSSGGGEYIVEKTVFINLCSEYTDGEVSTPEYINILKPSNEILQTPNAYTSSNLLDTLGELTGITLINSGEFEGATAQISESQTTAGDTGVYENEMVNTAWQFSGGTLSKVNLMNLNPDKFYQLYFLMPCDESTVRSITIDGITKTREYTTASASFGTLGNGLNDPEFIVFNNLTDRSSIEPEIKRVSGAYGGTIAMIVIEETNIAKA